MKHYHVVFGAYVRMYAEHTVEAENDRSRAQPSCDAKRFKLQGSAAISPMVRMPSRPR